MRTSLRNFSFVGSLYVPSATAAANQNLVYDFGAGGVYNRFSNGIVSPTEFTISAWVKPSQTASVLNIVCHSDGNPAVSVGACLRQTSTTFQGYCYASSAAKYVTGTTTISAGTWYHVAVTAKNSGYLRLYVNGWADEAATAIGTLWTLGNDWWVGVASALGGEYQGRLADVAIWNKQLTEQQIASLCLTGARNLPPTVESGSLVIFCPMSDYGDGASVTGDWRETVGGKTQTRTGNATGRAEVIPGVPRTLLTTGLQLALESDDFDSIADSTLVATWADKSGNARDFAQANDTFKPTVDQSRTVNGHATLRFTDTGAGASPRKLTAATFGSLTSLELFCVLKKDLWPSTNNTDYGAPFQFSRGAAGYSSHVPFTDSKVYESLGNNTRPGAAGCPSMAASFGVYQIVAATGNFSLTYNTTQFYTSGATTFDWNTTSASFEIGCGSDYAATAFSWAGNIAAIYLYSAILTAPQRQQIRAYILSKWGLWNGWG